MGLVRVVVMQDLAQVCQDSARDASVDDVIAELLTYCMLMLYYLLKRTITCHQI